VRLKEWKGEKIRQTKPRSARRFVEDLEGPPCLFTAEPFANCFRGGPASYPSVPAQRRMDSVY
jgi:hypothetical protein